jgi:cysteine-rich repeat protein
MMRRTLLVLGVLALIPGGSGAEISRRVDSVVFSIHVDVASELDLDELRDHLAMVRSWFESSRGPDDVACCTEIEAIDLEPFGTPGDGGDILDSQAKWNALGSRKAFVLDITWPSPTCGVGELGGERMAVDVTCEWISYVIAHERLHNAGVNHGTGDPPTFMDNGAAYLRVSECNAFRSLGSDEGSCTCMGPSVGAPALPDGTCMGPSVGAPALPDGASCSQDGEAGICAWSGLCLEGAAEGMFDDPFPLNTNAGSDAAGDNRPQVTTDGAGNWVAVWYSNDSLGGTIDTDWDILLSRSEDGGETWLPPAALNTNAATDSGGDGYPQVTTDGAGNWVAVWYSSDSLGGTLGTDYDILGSRSSDAGATWTPPLPLNTNAATDSGDDFRPQVTTDAAGNWVAAWISDDSLGGTIGTDADILVSRSSDAGASWAPPAVLNSNAVTDSGDDWYPEVTTDEAGNWLAVWMSGDSLGGTIGTDYDILVSRSSDAGATWTAPVPLNSNAATDSGNDWHPEVTTDGAGHWVAIWDGGESLGGTIGTDADIFVSRSTDAGATWTPPAALNTTAATDSAFDASEQVTTDGAGNWVAVWLSENPLDGTIGTDRDIVVARSTDGGVTWTAPAALNTNAVSDSHNDVDPQLTTDGQGTWVAVWTSWDPLGDFLGGSIGTDGDILVAVGSLCSDGILEAGEQCDDGNVADGDGCDHICQIEVEDSWEFFGVATGGTVEFHIDHVASDASLHVYEDTNSNGFFDPGEERDGGIGDDGGSVFDYAFDLDASVPDLGGVSIDLDLTTYDNNFRIDINGVTVVPLDPGDPAVFTPPINEPWYANSNGLPRLHITLTEASIDFEGSETTSSTTITTGLVYNQPTTNPIFVEGQNTITIVNPDGPGPDGIHFQIGLTAAFRVADVALQVSTFAGETAEDVAAKVAAEINADPALSQVGVFAFATGSSVITNGMITDREIHDWGLSPAVPGLSGWGLWLLVVLLVATTRRMLVNHRGASEIMRRHRR